MKKTTIRALAVSSVAIFLLAATVVTNVASATHQPANKVSVAGSSLEIMRSVGSNAADSSVHTLLTGSLKASNPTDLLIQVTLECALWTNIRTSGSSESEAIAGVKVWVEIDGVPVAVSGDDAIDTGKVTFCDRAFKMRTSGFNETQTIELYLRTKSANAFNWITMDVGSGTHAIVVKGQLDVLVTGSGDAAAAIGKRTLVVEPTKLANDVTI